MGARSKRAKSVSRAILFATPCVYCGRPSTTIDHKTPKSLGGGNDPGNRAPCCRGCNQMKGSLTEAEFREKLLDPAWVRERERYLAAAAERRAAEGSLRGVDGRRVVA